MGGDGWRIGGYGQKIGGDGPRKGGLAGGQVELATTSLLPVFCIHRYNPA